jgi:hypothetical protein
MRKEIFSALMASLCGRAINAIDAVSFINTNLCGEGVVSLSLLIEQSLELVLLNLSRNRIDDMNSTLRLSRALKLHPIMKYLYMKQCDIGNDPEILSVILQSDIESINLSHNNIDSLGAVKISEYIENNPPIKCLVLDNNRFNDDDAILISRALKRNTNLSRLSLVGNNFISFGVKALVASFFDGTSLNAISESNHTCKLHIFDSFPPSHQRPIQQLISSINDTLDRTSKILIALHDKESLLEYLADLSVELMPDVLSFVQRERDQIQSMSMMYAAMRLCNMPSIYSFRHCVSSNTKKKRDN